MATARTLLQLDIRQSTEASGIRLATAGKSVQIGAGNVVLWHSQRCSTRTEYLSVHKHTTVCTSVTGGQC